MDSRGTDGWRDMIESGPYLFDDDIFQADDPNIEFKGSIELDTFFVNDEPEREELTALNTTVITSPMDAEFCCDDPKECMCKYCCVSNNVTCPVDVVVAVDVCHCDNMRWVKTIEFLIHLVEELKEKVVDFRFSLVMFNEISETVISLDEWKPEWTLGQIYDKLDNYDLTTFFGRGTILHTGLASAYKQFDHELKRKSILVLFSNGVSQSSDDEVLKVAAENPGPEIISVTADSIDHCSGSICPNTDLLQDLTSDILVDGSNRRQFWAAKEVRQYIQNKFVCEEDSCEICDCDCDFTCEDPNASQLMSKSENSCIECPDIPCPVDLVFAIDMCHCDKQRFENARNFMIETAEKVIPAANSRNQKVRMSVVQFNEIAVRSTHFAEFDGMDTDNLDAFKEKVMALRTDDFRGMGTNMLTGVTEVDSVFEEEGMTQENRDDLGITTYKTEKILVLFSNGHSFDSRKAIMDKIGEIKETSNVRIIPVSADSAQENCEEANCPDDEFLSMIKDDSLDNWLDGSKLSTAVNEISKVIGELNCSDSSCDGPNTCPNYFEEVPMSNSTTGDDNDGDDKSTPEMAPEFCENAFGETEPVISTGESGEDGEDGNPMAKSGVHENPCPALNLAFIIDGSDSITDRPNGGQWKQVKTWVADVISDLNLDQRPGKSYVSVMQYAYDTEVLEEKWWAFGCDPKRRQTTSITEELKNWRQMNTTTNTYKATYNMMDSFDDNYVSYLSSNPFSILVIISDGEHRDTQKRDQKKLHLLKQKFNLIQVVQTSSIFNNAKDWEQGTNRIKTLKDKPNWEIEEFEFLQTCNDMCNRKMASIKNAPDDILQFYPEV